MTTTEKPHGNTIVHFVYRVAKQCDLGEVCLYDGDCFSHFEEWSKKEKEKEEANGESK